MCTLTAPIARPMATISSCAAVEGTTADDYGDSVMKEDETDDCSSPVMQPIAPAISTGLSSNNSQLPLVR